MIKITDKSLTFFKQLADEAESWNGTPLLPELNKSEKGNLTDLKKKDLVTTFKEDGCDFVKFTEAGMDLAKEHGYDIKNLLALI